MKKITFKGTDITLECNQLSVGDTLKSCILVGNDLNEVELTKTNGISKLNFEFFCAIN